MCHDSTVMSITIYGKKKTRMLLNNVYTPRVLVWVAHNKWTQWKGFLFARINAIYMDQFQCHWHIPVTSISFSNIFGFVNNNNNRTRMCLRLQYIREWHGTEKKNKHEIAFKEEETTFCMLRQPLLKHWRSSFNGFRFLTERSVGSSNGNV